MRFFLLLVGCLLGLGPASAQDAPLFSLGATSVAAEGAPLPAEWAFTPSVDTAGAAWQVVDARLPAGSPLPTGWEGSGWFRLRVTVDSALVGRPLGSFVNFPYRDVEIALSPGDTVLFMSDGFPEVFNEAGEMLGYDEAAEVFAGVGDRDRDPKAIIDHLVETSRSWRAARPLDDDMTFVVLKRSNVERRVSNE